MINFPVSFKVRCREVCQPFLAGGRCHANRMPGNWPQPVTRVFHGPCRLSYFLRAAQFLSFLHEGPAGGELFTEPMAISEQDIEADEWMDTSGKVLGSR